MTTDTPGIPGTAAELTLFLEERGDELTPTEATAIAHRIFQLDGTWDAPLAEDQACRIAGILRPGLAGNGARVVEPKLRAATTRARAQDLQQTLAYLGADLAAGLIGPIEYRAAADRLHQRITQLDPCEVPRGA